MSLIYLVEDDQDIRELEAYALENAGYTKAADRVMKAIMHVTGTKMKSQAAGKMGYSTTEIGDLVCEVL